MFDFLKRKKNSNAAQPVENKAEPEQQASQFEEKTGFFSRLRQGLSKTRTHFTQSLANLILGRKTIDAALLETIEEQLLLADIGVEACRRIISNLTEKVSRKQLNDAEALFTALKQDLQDLLRPCEKNLRIDASQKPFVILTVGVNGAGKTTTIGKLAKHLQNQGKKVMLAAGDTFRAAAIEQLQSWGERNQIPVIAQQQGSDSASVAYDALQAAKARHMDVLIVDTAGRLHTQSNLMQELQKIKRVLAKLDADTPHEVLLVLDAGNGQNALSQAQQFHQAVQVTGIALTKLDGTAKGGIIFAIAKNLGIPFRYIGVGESIEDLREFQAEEFVEALFAQDDP